MKRSFLLVPVAMIVGLPVAITLRPGRPLPSEGRPDTAPVLLTEIEQRVTAEGRVLTSHRWILAACESGVIRRLPIQRGERVNEDQVVIEIDTQELDDRIERVRLAMKVLKARAAGRQVEVERADVERDQFHRTLQRTECLAETGAVTQRELESARSEADLADLESRRAHHLLAESLAEVREQEGSLGQLTRRKENAPIRAPVNGVVARYLREVAVGMPVSAGEALGELVEDRPPVIRVRLDELDAVDVHPGQRATIRWAGHDRDRGHAGKVIWVAPAADQDDRFTFVECDIAMLDRDHTFRWGNTAGVEIITARRENSLTVPVDAVRVVQGATCVGVVTPQGVQTRPIKVGAVGLERVEVLEGLVENEEVVRHYDLNKEP